MHLTLNKKQKLCLLCVPGLVAALAGCGGSSGGDGGSAPALGPLQLTGAVQQAPAGAALNGYIVLFDQSPKVAATTDANGTFTLSVPRAAVTGKDTLSITDPSGALVDTVVVPANTTTLTNFDAGTINVSPPGAPASGI